MTHKVDARGLSCPQPVLMTLQAIKQHPQGRLEVLVDDGASRENIVRAAGKEGWIIVEDQAIGPDFRLVLDKP